MGNIADEILTEEQMIQLAEEELGYTEYEIEQAREEAEDEWMYDGFSSVGYDAITEMWNDATSYDL